MFVPDAVSSSSAVAGGSSTSFSHTVGVGKHKILVVSIGGSDTTNDRLVSTVTYNSISLTKAVERDGNNINATIWYLKNPPSGTANIAITWQGGVNFAAATGASFFLIDPRVPGMNNPLSGSNGGGVTNPSCTLPAARLALIVDAVYSDLNTNLTPGANQTQIGQISVNSGSDRVCSSYKIARNDAALGTDSMSWTGSALFQQVAATFRALDRGTTVI